MQYNNGMAVEIGDEVQIDKRYKGTVVVDLDAGHTDPKYPLDRWAYLHTGILVDTTYGGLLHYPTGHRDEIQLLRRARAAAAATC